ncbi:her-1 domain-containing protein [Ditylenchus destructor]|nr:her-1 domain-containing protein [Ditylenchus destructor]
MALKYFILAVFLINVADAMLHRELAERCCQKDFQDCCANTFFFNKPLTCKGMDYTELGKVSFCVSREMNFSNSLRVTEALCCHLVFTSDLNDESGKCLHLCHQIFKTPTLSPESKLMRIKECRVDHGMFPCFERCVHFYKQPRNSERVFRPVEQCDLTPLLPEFPLIIDY